MRFGYGDGYRALCFCGMQTASACDDAKASDIHSTRSRVNCHALEETALPPHLNTMGYGAYKNCSALKLVRVYADEGQKIAVSALIDDLSNEVALDMYDASGKLLTKLVFTEYEYGLYYSSRSAPI